MTKQGLKYIKQEALEEGYDLQIVCNGYESSIKNKKIKQDIIKLIEKAITNGKAN